MKTRTRINTRDVQAAIERGDVDALPVAEVEKTHQTRQPADERPSKKRERNQRVDKVVREVMIVGGETMKKVEKKATLAQTKQPDSVASAPTNGTQPANTNPIPEFKPCPLCGYGKSTATGKRFLVCKACDDRHKAYVAKVTKEIMAGGKTEEVLSKVAWVLKQLDLERFEQELEEVRQKRTGVHERAIEKAKTASAGKSIPREVFISLVTEYERTETNELYYLVKRLNGRLKAAIELKPELEQMVAEAAKKASETAQTTDAPAEAEAEATLQA